MECEPSRFLEELPGDDIEWQGVDKKKPVDKKVGGAYLAQLRERLAN